MNDRASHFLQLTRFDDQRGCPVDFWVDAHLVLAISPIIGPSADNGEEMDVVGSVVILSWEVEVLGERRDAWYVRGRPSEVRASLDEALRVSDGL